ncbi:hypothetical protein RFI_21530, partial [Reticulomyxa filosa]
GEKDKEKEIEKRKKEIEKGIKKREQKKPSRFSKKKSDASFWADQKSDFEMEGEVEEYDEEEEDEEEEEPQEDEEDEAAGKVAEEKDEEEEEDKDEEKEKEKEEDEDQEAEEEEDEDQERDVLGDADEDVDEDEDEDDIDEGKRKRRDKDVDDVEWDESSSHHDSDAEHTEVQQRTTTTEGDIGVFGEALLAQMKQRSFWLMSMMKGKGPAQATRRRRKRPEKLEKAEKAEKTDKTTATESKAEEEPKSAEKGQVQQWPVRVIQREFSEALKMRGKTGVDRNEVVEKLKKIAEQCKLANSQQAQITANSILVSFYFDSASRKQAGMSGSRWKTVYKLVKDIIRALVDNFKVLRMSPFAELGLNFAKTEEKEVKQEDDK